MDQALTESLRRFADGVDRLLGGQLAALYLFGSAVYDDLHPGYSDLDFFAVSARPLTVADFDASLALRKELKESGDPYLPMLEGEFVWRGALGNDFDHPVLYWGTTRELLKQRYGLAGFSLRGLLERGVLLAGTEVRGEIPPPDDAVMLGEVDRMVGTLRQWATVTNEDIHSADWLFLICQSLHWLRTGQVTGKSTAARWALTAFADPWCTALPEALALRQDPALATEPDRKAWLAALGPTVQAACDRLEAEAAACRQRMGADGVWVSPA